MKNTTDKALALAASQRAADSIREQIRTMTEDSETVEAVARERLFIGCFPAGISYADRWREERGDYKRLAFLPFSTLVLDFDGRPDKLLRRLIEEHAATLQARVGEEYPVSTTGQTVLLGPPLSPRERALNDHGYVRRNTDGIGYRVLELTDGGGTLTIQVGDNLTNVDRETFNAYLDASKREHERRNR